MQATKTLFNMNVTNDIFMDAVRKTCMDSTEVGADVRASAQQRRSGCHGTDL
jgi:hypothetical protein